MLSKEPQSRGEPAVDWDRVYLTPSPAYGQSPDMVIRKYVNIIPSGLILDLGCGDGRNALFLAEHGFRVVAVDQCETAVTKCNEQARAARVAISVFQADIMAASWAGQNYSLIILDSVLPFVPRDRVNGLLAHIFDALSPDGLLFVSTFVEEDTILSNILRLAGSDCTELIYSARSYELDLTHGEPHHHHVDRVLVRKRA